VDLLDTLADRSCPALVFLDAARASVEAAAGTWQRIDYHRQPELLARQKAPLNTHALGIADILELGLTLGVLPPVVWVYAAFGKQFECGAALSDECQPLVTRVADAVEGDLQAFFAERDRTTDRPRNSGEPPCTS